VRCCFTTEVGTGDGLGGGNQVLVQVGAALCRPIKGLLQQMTQQGHHPQKYRSIAHGRQAAMACTTGSITPLALGKCCQLDWRSHRHRAAEAIGLQPAQIPPDGGGISKTLPV
jgi:hypothetical protein